MAERLFSQDEGVVVAASGEWSGRLARVLGGDGSDSASRLSSFICCSNVYETTAAVVELLRREPQVRAGIMVDNLSAQEMRVFETLARMDRVRTVAVSAGGRRGKLARAQQLGAHELLCLEPLPAAVKVEPQTPAARQRAAAPVGADGEVVKFSYTQRPIAPAGSAENSLMDLAAKAIESARITQKEQKTEQAKPQTTTRKAGLKEQPAEPLISDEEREALLG